MLIDFKRGLDWPRFEGIGLQAEKGGSLPAPSLQYFERRSMVSIKDAIWGESIIERYLQPPVVKFRLLVGYPERPLDFREINVGMVVASGYGFRDSHGHYTPQSFNEAMRKMSQKLAESMDKSLLDLYSGPEKDK
jgi:hypothetical protein